MNSFNRLMRKRRKKILLTALGVVASFVIVALLFIPVQTKKADTERTYAELINLVTEENYSEAYEKANSIVGSNYEDTTAILYLCNSHMLYEQGDVLEAYEEINKVTFRYITDEQLSKIEEYKEMLKAECEIILAEDGVSLVESEEEANRKIKHAQNIKTKVKTTEEEFAYTDGEEFSKNNENNNTGENNE